MAVKLNRGDSKSAVVQHVTSTWDNLHNDRKDLQDTWERCLLAWLCTFDKKWVEFAKKANRSHRYVSISFDAVETVLSQLEDTIFPMDDWFNVEPLVAGGTSTLDDELAEPMRIYMRTILKRTKFRPEAMLGMREMLLLGNVPWSMRWKVDWAVNYPAYVGALGEWTIRNQQREQEYRQALTHYQQIVQQSALQGVPAPPPPNIPPPDPPPVQKDRAFEGPQLVVGDIFNFVTEPFPNESSTAFRAQRTWRTKAYLKRMSRPDDDGNVLYSNIDEVQDVDREDQAKHNEVLVEMMRSAGMSMPHDKSKVELIEAWGTFEVPDGSSGNYHVYENHVATIANGRTLIRFEPSPLVCPELPLQLGRLITKKGMTYGIGILEKALDEQDTANAVHNQNIDAVACVINPEYEIVEDGIIDPLKPSGPGQRHRVAEKGTINPIQKNFQGLPLGNEQLMAAISRFERFTGAVNTSGGSSESATRTARNTGVVSSKLNKWARAGEDSFIEPAINMMFQMVAQYVDTPQIARVTQNNKIERLIIPVEAIMRGWLVELNGSQYIADKQQQLQDDMMFMQVVGQPIFFPMINWPALLKQIAVHMNMKDIDNIIDSSPETQAKIMQMVQASMMGEQGGSGEGESAGSGQEQQSQAAAQGGSLLGPIGAAV